MEPGPPKWDQSGAPGSLGARKVAPKVAGVRKVGSKSLRSGPAGPFLVQNGTKKEPFWMFFDSKIDGNIDAAFCGGV